MNRNSSLTFLLLLLGLSVAQTSCYKKDKCGEEITLLAPTTVEEGEDLVLEVTNFEDAEVNYFLWEFPDMTPYNFLSEGRVDGGEVYTIEGFNPKDIGTYSVKMYPKDSDCDPVILEVSVDMTPKTCPCEEPTATNTLYYDPGYKSQFTEEVMTGAYYDSGSEDNSVITFSGTNDIEFFFGRQLTDISRSYRVAGGGNTFWDEDNDPHMDVHIYFSAWDEGFYNYFTEKDETLYITRTSDQMILQFCDLDVDEFGVHKFTLSGKFVVDL